MLSRQREFETELARRLARSQPELDWRPVLTDMFKMIGEEINFIEKNTTSAVSPASSSGGTVIISGTTVVTGGPPAVGVISLINRPVIAGPNLITFSSPLSSLTYGGFLVLSDSSGMLIDSAELRMRASLMTTTSFVYTAPAPGILFGFAMVQT
jgi:hypothetical protein